MLSKEDRKRLDGKLIDIYDALNTGDCNDNYAIVNQLLNLTHAVRDILYEITEKDSEQS